jgi:hypothetical protein
MGFPGIKGFSSRNIRNMRRFYEEYIDDEIWQPLVAKLPWTHNMILINKLKDKEMGKCYYGGIRYDFLEFNPMFEVTDLNMQVLIVKPNRPTQVAEISEILKSINRLSEGIFSNYALLR